MRTKQNHLTKTPLLFLGGVNWQTPLGRCQSGVVDSRTATICNIMTQKYLSQWQKPEQMRTKQNPYGTTCPALAGLSHYRISQPVENYPPATPPFFVIL